MIEVLERSADSVVGLRVSGRITEEDYDRILPELKRVIQEHGEVDILCRFDGFKGVEPGAVWKDLKFYAGHVRDLRRCAILKEQEWQGTLSMLFGPLSGIETRVFEQPEEDAAWEWLFRKAEEDRDWKDEDAGRRHAELYRKRIDQLVEDLRGDAKKVRDSQAKAVFEMAAEILVGLGSSFSQYEKRSRTARPEDSASESAESAGSP